MSLTPKQEAFTCAYVETGNASEAYRRAYKAEKSSPEVVWKEASILLANRKVSVRVQNLQSQAVERTMESRALGHFVANI